MSHFGRDHTQLGLTARLVCIDCYHVQFSLHRLVLLIWYICLLTAEESPYESHSAVYFSQPEFHIVQVEPQNKEAIKNMDVPNEHLLCEVSARPCCIGLQGECTIISQVTLCTSPPPFVLCSVCLYCIVYWILCTTFSGLSRYYI